MFGTSYFGQTYYAGVVFEPPPGGSRDNCGGMFGTASFGQPYFGQHIQCGEPIPPPPPPPTPSEGSGGWVGGGRRKRRQETIKVKVLKSARAKSIHLPESENVAVNRLRDDEELLLLLSLFMKIK